MHLVLDCNRRTDRMAKPKTSAPALEESPESTLEEASADDSFYGLVWLSVCGYAIYRIVYNAYRIRMAAIDEYGPVIHEFDPYFNYRATEVRRSKSNMFVVWIFQRRILTFCCCCCCFFLLVSLRARRCQVLSVVRLQGLVPPGTPRGDHHLSRHAVHGRVH